MTQKLKNKKVLLALLLLILLIIIVIEALLALSKDKKSSKDDKKTTAESDIIGYGDSNEPVPESYTNPVGEMITDSSGEGEIVGEPGMPTPKSRTYEYNSPDGTKLFKITTGDTSWDNVLTISGTDVEISNVVKGAWSKDNKYIMFTKIKGEKSADAQDFQDTGDIWIMTSEGKDQKLIFNSGIMDNVDYVSNGTRIGFVTMNKVGLMDINGENLQILLEFEPYFPVPGVISVPTINYVDETNFTVDILKSDGTSETKSFSF